MRLVMRHCDLGHEVWACRNHVTETYELYADELAEEFLEEVETWAAAKIYALDYFGELMQ